MSTPTDMLVDLGLNLSDSELEDSAPAILGNRGADAEMGDDGESDISDISSGECSSGDDDMDAIPGKAPPSRAWQRHPRPHRLHVA